MDPLNYTATSGLYSSSASDPGCRAPGWQPLCLAQSPLRLPPRQPLPGATQRRQAAQLPLPPHPHPAQTACLAPPPRGTVWACPCLYSLPPCIGARGMLGVTWNTVAAQMLQAFTSAATCTDSLLHIFEDTLRLVAADALEDAVQRGRHVHAQRQVLQRWSTLAGGGAARRALSRKLGAHPHSLPAELADGHPASPSDATLPIHHTPHPTLPLPPSPPALPLPTTWSSVDRLACCGSLGCGLMVQRPWNRFMMPPPEGSSLKSMVRALSSSSTSSLVVKVPLSHRKRQEACGEGGGSL